MVGITAPKLGRHSRIGHFTRHFVEMCVVMCVSGGVLNALIFLAGPAWIGYSDLRQQSPEWALLVIAFDYALPMAAWMRARGMQWRPTLEMSGATVGLAIVVSGLAWLGVITGSSLHGWIFGFCGPACVVMFVVMLFRLDLYASQAGHVMRRRARAASAA
jgi:hypothetical protein